MAINKRKSLMEEIAEIEKAPAKAKEQEISVQDLGAQDPESNKKEGPAKVGDKTKAAPDNKTTKVANPKELVVDDVDDLQEEEDLDSIVDKAEVEDIELPETDDMDVEVDDVPPVEGEEVEEPVEEDPAQEAVDAVADVIDAAEKAKEAIETATGASSEEEVEDEIDDVDVDEIPVEDVPMDDDMAAIDAAADESELPEAFKAKAKTILETAIKTRIAKAKKAIAEAYKSKSKKLVENYRNEAKATVAKHKQFLENKAAKFLDYSAEEWISENKLAVEQGLRNEISESLISGLRKLFLEHNMVVPEGKEDLYKKSLTENKKLKEELNSKMTEAIEQKNLIKQMTKQIIISEAVKGLTVADAAKIEELAEAVDFTTVSEFQGKVKTLKESYTKPKVKKLSSLTEGTGVDNPEAKKAEVVDKVMAAYEAALAKTISKIA